MWKKPERKKTVDCRQVEATLIAYLKDGLTPARRQVVEDHLAACDACTRSVQQAQILESELRLQAAGYNPTLSPEASARIHERVYKRMRRGLMVQRAVKLAGVAVAVVAIALVAVGAMALWQERPWDFADEQNMTPELVEGAPTRVPGTSVPVIETSIAPTSVPQPTETPAPARSLYQTYDLGEQVLNVTASDLNGDGYVDLAVPDAGSSVLRLFYNLGDGTFLNSVDYTTGDAPLQVVAADLNADSYSDLVVAHMPTAEISKLSVLLNSGDGTFQEAVDYSLGYDSWWVRVADLDGDLDLDLVTGFTSEPPPNDEARVGVWLNDGHGAFQEGPQYDVGMGFWRGEANVGDLDGDSIPDLVLSYYPLAKVTVHLGSGDGTFGESVEYEGAFLPVEVVAADLNGDAYTDLAIPSERGTLSLLLNNGDGTFQESVNYEIGASAWFPSAVAYVDADAYPDLLVPDPGASTIQVLMNGGDGTFQLAEGYETDFSPGGVLVADLNGDSQPELLIFSEHEAPVDGHAVLSVQPLERGD